MTDLEEELSGLEALAAGADTDPAPAGLLALARASCAADSAWAEAFLNLLDTHRSIAVALLVWRRAAASGATALAEAAASILSRRVPDLPEVAALLQRRADDGSRPPPVAAPFYPLAPRAWNPFCGDESIPLRALAGWGGIHAVQTLWVVGAHEFREHATYRRLFPSLRNIVLFEPNPRLVASLRESCAHSGVTLVPCALSDHDGSARLKISSNEGLSSSLFDFGLHSQAAPDVTFVEEVAVSVRRVDSVLAEHRLPLPDVLVIDAQGAEDKILSGTPAAVLEHARVIYVETSKAEVYRGGTSYHAVQQRLSPTHRYVAFASIPGHHGLHGNSLFVRRLGRTAAPAPVAPADPFAHALSLARQGLLRAAARLFDASTHPNAARNVATLEALIAAPALPATAALVDELDQPVPLVGAEARPLWSLTPADAATLRLALTADFFGATRPDVSSRPLYLWGAGAGGRRVLALCRAVGLNVAALVDRDPAKHGSTLESLAVVSPDALKAAQPRPFVIIASMYAPEIARQLRGLGFGQADFCIPAPFFQP